MAICLRLSTGQVVQPFRAASAKQTSFAPAVQLGVQRRHLNTTAALGSKSQPAKKGTKVENITPEPSFNLQLGLLAVSGLAWYENITPLAAFCGLLGVFLTFQATRIRFTFDDEAIELTRNGQESQNIVVGGQNRWSYDSFINWEFWFPSFPILVYFKETQTKPEGQVHFFPIIFNGKQLYEAMVERCGPSKGSGPK